MIQSNLIKQATGVLLAVLLQLSARISHGSADSDLLVISSLVTLEQVFIRSGFYQWLYSYKGQESKWVAQSEDKSLALQLLNPQGASSREIQVKLSGSLSPDLLNSYGVAVDSFSASSHESIVQLQVNALGILALDGVPGAPGILFADENDIDVQGQSLPGKLLEEKLLDLRCRGEYEKKCPELDEKQLAKEHQQAVVSIESLNHQIIGVVVDTDEEGYVVLIIYSITGRGTVQLTTVETHVHEHSSEGQQLLASLSSYINVTLLRKMQRALLVKASQGAVKTIVLEPFEDEDNLLQRLGPRPGSLPSQLMGAESLIGCISRGKFHRGADGLAYCEIPGIQQAMMNDGGSGATGGTLGSNGHSGAQSTEDNRGEEHRTTDVPKDDAEKKNKRTEEASKEDSTKKVNSEREAEGVRLSEKDENGSLNENEKKSETGSIKQEAGAGNQPQGRAPLKPLYLNTGARFVGGNGFAQPSLLPQMTRTEMRPAVSGFVAVTPPRPVFSPPPQGLIPVGAYFVSLQQGRVRMIPIQFPNQNLLPAGHHPGRFMIRMDS